jgi:hypothetical protein
MPMPRHLGAARRNRALFPSRLRSRPAGGDRAARNEYVEEATP